MRVRAERSYGEGPQSRCSTADYIISASAPGGLCLFSLKFELKYCTECNLHTNAQYKLVLLPSLFYSDKI